MRGAKLGRSVSTPQQSQTLALQSNFLTPLGRRSAHKVTIVRAENAFVRLWGLRVMDWKRELEALIEDTMALAKGVKPEPISDVQAAMRSVEQALADTPKPVGSLTALPSILARSESDEIRQRVSNFKAHQEKMARDREDYYSQIKARMMASVDPSLASPNSRKNPPA
jgi:hypothetical protein